MEASELLVVLMQPGQLACASAEADVDADAASSTVEGHALPRHFLGSWHAELVRVFTLQQLLTHCMLSGTKSAYACDLAAVLYMVGLGVFSHCSSCCGVIHCV